MRREQDSETRLHEFNPSHCSWIEKNETGQFKHILLIKLPVVVQQCGVCGRCIVDELCSGTVFGRFVMKHR